MNNNDKFGNALGLSRRAGKLGMGHSDVKYSLRKNNASLVLLASDASDRLKDEMKFLCGKTECVELDETMFELSELIGRQVGVISVNDAGLSALVKKSLDEKKKVKLSTPKEK